MQEYVIYRGLGAFNFHSNIMWWSHADILNSDNPDHIDLSYHTNENFTNDLQQANALTLSVSDSKCNDEFLNVSNNFTKLCRILHDIFRFYQYVRNPTCKDELKHASNVLLERQQIKFLKKLDVC